MGNTEIKCVQYKPFGNRLPRLDADTRSFMRASLQEDRLHYHGFDHTFDPQNGVIAVANSLFMLERPEREHFSLDHELLVAAATLHDVGLAIDPTYKGHEARGVLYAHENLRRFDYNFSDENKILAMIGDTDPTKEPGNYLAGMLKDADVFNIGSYLFWVANEQLRKEFNVTDMRKWVESTINFFRSNRFYTASANSLCGAGRDANLAAFELMLKQLDGAN